MLGRERPCHPVHLHLLSHAEEVQTPDAVEEAKQAEEVQQQQARDPRPPQMGWKGSSVSAMHGGIRATDLAVQRGTTPPQPQDPPRPESPLPEGPAASKPQMTMEQRRCIASTPVRCVHTVTSTKQRDGVRPSKTPSTDAPTGPAWPLHLRPSTTPCTDGPDYRLYRGVQSGIEASTHMPLATASGVHSGVEAEQHMYLHGWCPLTSQWPLGSQIVCAQLQVHTSCATHTLCRCHIT